MTGSQKSLLVVVVVLALSIVAVVYGRFSFTNPDPNHMHADFAVWILGEKLDFSGEEFMSTETKPLNPYLHLHDGNGHVIHSHKPGLTLRDFLESIGVQFRLNPLSPSRLCVTFSHKKEICDAGDGVWGVVVNAGSLVRRQDVRSIYDIIELKDLDRILIVFPATDGDSFTALKRYWSQMTNDACLYSRTCPWRGAVPVENCVSDPTVPCIE